jgi:hypothetical protein
MNSDPIGNLLRQADDRGRLHSAPSPAELSDKVLRIVRQRRRRKRVAGAFVAVLVVFGVGAMTYLVNRSPVRAPSVALVAEDLDSLRARIAMQERMIERMLACERRAGADVRLARIGLASEDESLERAAARVVYKADKMLRSTGPTEPVIKAYSSVIDCFPNTISARLAHERLNRMKKES